MAGTVYSESIVNQELNSKLLYLFTCFKEMEDISPLYINILTPCITEEVTVLHVLQHGPIVSAVVLILFILVGLVEPGQFQTPPCFEGFSWKSVPDVGSHSKLSDRV